MTELHDQDLEPRKRSFVQDLVIWISVGTLLGWGATSAFDFYETWSESKQGKTDLDISSYMSQSVKWNSCDEDMFIPADWQSEEFDSDAAECGTFDVPASYSSEFGRDLPDLTIAVLKSPALDQANKLGTLYFNPGGPGESGIEVIQYIDIPEEIRQKYDVVGFDPRGVGKSSPIKCNDTDSIDYYFETVSSPENEHEGNADGDWYQNSIAKCANQNPNWWVMTTMNTVQDMDIMREVVGGDEKLNFVGFSYGTTLAVEYIRAFPEHAGRIVLDSVTSNDDPGVNRAELEGTYEALVALFDMCAKDAKCPGETVSEVEDLIFAAQDKANTGKLEGFARYLSSSSVNSEFVASDDDLLYYGIFNLTYGSTEDSYPDFSDAMNQLVKGSAEYFEYEALEYFGWYLNDEDKWERNNSLDLLDIVNCLDQDYRDLRTRDEVIQDNNVDAAADPFTTKFYASDSGYLYVGDRRGCEWSWLAFDDPKIPDPPEVMPSPVNKSGQTFLVIGSMLDTVTPIENARDTASRMQSRLLTYEGSGHAPSFGGISCIDNAVAKYLVEGNLPDKDIVCAAK